MSRTRVANEVTCEVTYEGTYECHVSSARPVSKTSGVVKKGASFMLTDTRTRRSPIVVVAAVVGALVFLVPGIWAFFWPASFYDNIATFPPYNRHLFHDLGAFQLAVGAAMLAALVWTDALFVALLGGAVGMVMHAISHFLDHGLGGRDSDAWVLSVIAIVVLIGLALRAPARSAR
jgi:hypothetical protein